MNEITLQQKIDILTDLINSEVSTVVDFLDPDDDEYSEYIERSKQSYAVLLAILSDYAPHARCEFSNDFQEEVDKMREENENE